MTFEWDEEKRLKNIESHSIDFVRAKEIWKNPVLEILSSQAHHGEDRFLAIGQTEDSLITVIYTWRGDKRRLISARKARNNEKKHYENEIR
jgi:uncharacterized DUF497 family protein